MHFPQERPHINILDVFAAEKNSQHGFLRASAPMVRYSKLEFRLLLRKYGVKLCFTPMIIADSFNNSAKARENEFTTTCLQDQPLIAQFAAKNSTEFVTAAQLIYPYVDGVDLNCGCPQSWAITKGYGCGLLRKPELVCDIIQTVRRSLPADFSISLKIRLLNGTSSIRSTVEFARQLEKCGATFLTLHGRNMWQRSSDPVNIEAMATLKNSLQIPLICNGNVRSWQDACDLYAQTNANGIMAARGLLSNPTLFKPESAIENSTLPLQCVQDWLNIATRAGDNIKFQSFHHHLTFMWSNHIKRNLRQEFNNLTKKAEVFQFFEDKYGLRPSEKAEFDPLQYTKCTYAHFAQQSAEHISESLWTEDSNGKFFSEFQADIEKSSSDCNLEDSFFADLS